jgi:imidazolonepropionase-like amidohydrolase
MQTLITNVRVWDGSGSEPFAADVLLEGDRIKGVGARLAAPQAETVDGGGCLLMPGLVEAHAHLSFADVMPNHLVGEIPPEEHTLITMHNARKLLDAGFTSCFSAASAKARLDVVIRNEIEAGRIPGPRLKAASPELTVTGGLGDNRMMHLYRESFGIVVDGADEMRRTVRMLCREGVDSIKLNISGDFNQFAARPYEAVMTDEEVAAAVEVARKCGRTVSCHARAADSVKMAMRHGLDLLYHCEYADEEALDLIEAERDRVFVAPALGSLWAGVHEGEPHGLTREVAREIRLEASLEAAILTAQKMRKRGIRVLPGGDYGFPWTPQGTNARDLEIFVKEVGFSATDTLVAATRHGGALMGCPDELGVVKAGAYADLLLVDGDPTQDISILRDGARLLGIMKAGQWRKAPPRPARRAQAAE